MMEYKNGHYTINVNGTLEDFFKELKEFLLTNTNWTFIEEESNRYYLTFSTIPEINEKFCIYSNENKDGTTDNLMSSLTIALKRGSVIFSTNTTKIINTNIIPSQKSQYILHCGLYSSKDIGICHLRGNYDTANTYEFPTSILAGNITLTYAHGTFVNWENDKEELISLYNNLWFSSNNTVGTQNTYYRNSILMGAGLSTEKNIILVPVFLMKNTDSKICGYIKNLYNASINNVTSKDYIINGEKYFVLDGCCLTKVSEGD